MARDLTPLFDAITAGDADAVERLLTGEPALASARREDGVSAVLWARYAGQHDCLRALLAAGPSLDAFEAAAVGDLDRLAALLGDDPSLMSARTDDGWTALHLAAFFGKRECAEILLERGADVDAETTNAMKNRPLHAAAAGRHLDVCRLLLDRGASPNAKQAGGFTPLHAAAKHGDEDLVELLLKYGASPNLRDDEERRAADLAEAEGHVEIAARLR